MLKDEHDQICVKEGMFIHPATSNEVEYRALILGLEIMLEHGVTALQVLGCKF